jgi:hypothetical protein
MASAAPWERKLLGQASNQEITEPQPGSPGRSRKASPEKHRTGADFDLCNADETHVSICALGEKKMNVRNVALGQNLAPRVSLSREVPFCA